MRHFLLFLLLTINFAKAQGVNDGWIVRKALDIPKAQSNSTQDIATYIRTNFSSDRDKARAIYAWVTANIRYTTDSANIINLGMGDSSKVTMALRRRRGVCENYAAIFTDIAVKSGLTSYVIAGYTKQNGALDKTGHSWSVALLDNVWQLFDPTWDEGKEENPKYFTMPPEEFVETHIPYDPLWQLLHYPVTQQQFYSGRSKNEVPYFSYPDSIKAYLEMDSLHRFQSSAARMQRDELNNSLVKNNYASVRMNIETIHQDKDVDLYNSSVADLNAATAILNNLIQYRNEKLTPPKTDVEINEELKGINGRLTASVRKLDEIDRSEAVFKIGTDKVRERINALSEKARGMFVLAIKER